VYGGSGDDLIVGGYGNDTLSGGPGADQINAQDGQKDTIVFCAGEYDAVYYDRGLDVLQGCIAPQGTAGKDTGLTAGETSKATTLSAEQPPEGLFEHSGKVLVEHEDKELCLPEKELKGHLKHGDEILNPAGCSSAEQGRR
jgi:Ca2+-binding RTX toxin-like protein